MGVADLSPRNELMALNICIPLMKCMRYRLTWLMNVRLHLPFCHTYRHTLYFHPVFLTTTTTCMPRFSTSCQKTSREASALEHQSPRGWD